MTGLLEKALRRMETLPAAEQDNIAAQILDTLEDEEAWARRFQDDPEKLRRLASEAMAEHERGESRPINELLGD